MYLRTKAMSAARPVAVPRAAAGRGRGRVRKGARCGFHARRQPARRRAWPARRHWALRLRGSSPILLGDGFIRSAHLPAACFRPRWPFSPPPMADPAQLPRLPLCRAAERRLESLFFARETPAVSIKRAHDLSCELKNGYFRHLLLRAIPFGAARSSKPTTHRLCS